MLGIVSGRPVVVWSAGIGSFNNRLTRFLARFVLNRVDMILAREEVTKDYLKALGINKPKMYVTADHAFSMEPVPSNRVAEILANEGISRNENPLIGISASQLIHRYAFPGVNSRDGKYHKYVEVMARTTDFLVDKLNAKVMLVPHVITPVEDDRIISRNIYERVGSKDNVMLVKGDYRADELKGLIGMCDMFIGCRMHATIASTSMGVPTIAVVYGQKSLGIIGDMMGQEKYIVEIGNYEPEGLLDELKARIDSAWGNRESIKKELVVRAQAAKERTLLNGSLIKGLLKEV
jgi:polysaccharide pyruvyl transferase WcaK-like protein